MERTRAIVEKLVEASRKKAVSSWLRLEWPVELDRDQWFTSPELVSLHGTPVWQELDEPARKRLSFFEAVNFFSLNIHGEKPLVQGLAQRLYARGEPASAYLHHFLAEENDHMTWFGGFCERYAGKVYRDRKMVFSREYESGEEDFLFFARVLIFEELVDVYNQRMGSDERLAPIVREINRLHHLDESRHLVFGRLRVRELFEAHAPSWSAGTLAAVREYLAGYLNATWREYYNPDVYADAGLDEPYDLVDLAWKHPASRARRAEVSSGVAAFLVEHGILEQEPIP